MSGAHTVDKAQGMSANQGGDKKANVEQRPIIQWQLNSLQKEIQLFDFIELCIFTFLFNSF